MKHCTSCGKELSDQAKFCTSCGKKYPEDIMKNIQPVTETEKTRSQNVTQDTTAPQPKPISVEETAHQAKTPQEGTPVSRTEPKSQENPVKDKKHKKPISKGKIILFSVLVVVLAAVIAAGILLFRWYTSTEQQVLRALDDGNYDAALQIVREDVSASESDALASKLKERIANIKTGFTDGSIEYASARMELESIGKMNVNGISADLREVQTYVNDLNQSRTDFATAESFFTTGDYAEAIAHYQSVIEEDANYETAVKKLAEAVSRYREEILAKAAEYADAELYSDSIALLNEALSTIPNDTKITEQIRIYEKDNAEKLRVDALATAADYAEDGDYLHAFQALDSAIKRQGSNAELVSAYNKYCNQYVSQVISEVDGNVTDKDFDGAISVLNAALKELPANEILNAKLEEVKAKSPIPITTLTAINSGRWGTWNEGSPQDPFGNDYSTACNYVITNFDSGEKYTEYRVYGKYTALTGTIAPHTQIEEGRSGYLQVYIDDILVFTSQDIGRKTDAISFEIDISGSEYIKIVINSDYHGYLILSNVQLWP